MGWHEDLAHNNVDDASGVTVRYDAASQNYIIALPYGFNGAFIPAGEDSSFWYDGLKVFKPSTLQLSYTSFASGHFNDSNAQDAYIFTFGSPTPSAGVPVTGTATYDAYAVSFSGENAGSAVLQFDFGAGTLGGHFDVLNWGRYDFVNTVFGLGSTTFSGGMSKAGTNDTGSFEGMFTGPAAQELMARWSANSGSLSTYGVWVGKQH